MALIRDWGRWLARHMPHGIDWHAATAALLDTVGGAIEEQAQALDEARQQGIWPPTERWESAWRSCYAWPWAYAVTVPDVVTILGGDWGLTRNYASTEIPAIAAYWGLEASLIGTHPGTLLVALEGVRRLRAGDRCGSRLVGFQTETSRACATWLDHCVPVGVSIIYMEG